MTTNPLYNALLAGGYISGLVLSISQLQRFSGKPETILIPIAILCLLVLSVTVMATVFFLKPVQMYLDGSKKEAVGLLVKTMAYFAGLTIGIFGAMLFLALQ